MEWVLSSGLGLGLRVRLGLGLGLGLGRELGSWTCVSERSAASMASPSLRWSSSKATYGCAMASKRPLHSRLCAQPDLEKTTTACAESAGPPRELQR